jgi:hypothetical protein
MTSKSSTIRAPKPARQAAKVVEAELDELLANLGRLIAREYVTLLEELRRPILTGRRKPDEGRYLRPLLVRQSAARKHRRSGAGLQELAAARGYVVGPAHIYRDEAKSGVLLRL